MSASRLAIDPVRLRVFLLRTVELLYGLFWFGIWGTVALVEGHLIWRPPRKFQAEIEQERSKLWDLSKSPYPGVYHAFEDLDSGLRLHYLTNSIPTGREVQKKRNLVIFIHGFPDTSSLWLETMADLEAISSCTTLVAIDLPGYGGSQGLSAYGPNDVLDLLVHVICNMRERYLNGEAHGKVTIVSHDWGAFLGYRLASFAPGIADHFVLSSTIFVEVAKENMDTCLTNAGRLFRLWLKNPLKVQLLRGAGYVLAPMVDQTIKSSYIFQFNLPAWLVGHFGSLGNSWFLTRINEVRFGHPRGAWTASNPSTNVLTTLVQGMAESLGPNPRACATIIGDGDARGYPSAVHQRAASVDTAFFENIRLYREGLATRPWVLLESTRTRLERLHSMQIKEQTVHQKTRIRPGAFNTPATVLWGMADVALNFALVAHGVEKFMTPGSQVVTLPQTGHWLPAERAGVEMLAKTITWSLQSGELSISKSQAHTQSLRKWLEAEIPPDIEWNILVET